MGGCCCCFTSRRSEPARAPTYYYCPRTSEERQPLSANHGTPIGISGEILVDTNLDTTNPDTYTSPPRPLPFDIDFGHAQTPKDNHGTKCGTESEIEHSSSGDNANPSHEKPPKDDLELTCSKVVDDNDLKKPVEPIVAIIEEEDCPICLEEYTDDNPKLVTKCEHSFHLCCLLEWMERSDTCPVCDQDVLIDEALM